MGRIAGGAGSLGRRYTQITEVSQLEWARYLLNAADATSGPASGAGKVDVLSETPGASGFTSFSSEAANNLTPDGTSWWYWRLVDADGNPLQWGDNWFVRASLLLKDFDPASGTDPRQGWTTGLCSTAPITTPYDSADVWWGHGIQRRNNKAWMTEHRFTGSGSFTLSIEDTLEAWPSEIYAQTAWRNTPNKRLGYVGLDVLDSAGVPISSTGGKADDSYTINSGLGGLDQSGGDVYLALAYHGQLATASSNMTGNLRLQAQVQQPVSWAP